MQHLAIIPDGNRRWAAQNKLESMFGHQRGMEQVRMAIRTCIQSGIRYLSFYTFSLENFKRSELEKKYLFNLLADGFSKELPELVKEGIRVRFIGDRQKFPDQLASVVKMVEEQTKHLTRLNLSLLFCYGGTAEIVAAVKQIAQQAKDGHVEVEAITERTVHDALWTADLPDPDLIIRAGGESRLSNYLLYQAAYSEFRVLETYWPAVTEAELAECIEKFNQTKRNFGQ
jgi:undecaprenyl diphosphate synthase